MSQVLSELVAELNAGRLRVVDLTQPLSPQTPLLPLPPQWNNTPAFRIWELSHYDERGPAWYWNAFETGEHTGTHFDAPVHWISGKDLPDNSVDRILPKKFIGPACVIDVTAELEKDPDYLLSPERVRIWEQQHGRIVAGAWVLLRTSCSRRADPKEYIATKVQPHRFTPAPAGRGSRGVPRVKRFLVPFQLFGAIPRNEKAHHFTVRNGRRLQANPVGTALAICDDYISVFDADVADFRRQAQLFAVFRRRQEPPHGALQRGLWNGQRPELPTRGLKTQVAILDAQAALQQQGKILAMKIEEHVSLNAVVEQVDLHVLHRRLNFCD